MSFCEFPISSIKLNLTIDKVKWLSLYFDHWHSQMIVHVLAFCRMNCWNWLILVRVEVYSPSSLIRNISQLGGEYELLWLMSYQFWTNHNAHICKHGSDPFGFYDMEKLRKILTFLDSETNLNLCKDNFYCTFMVHVCND